MLSKSPMKLLRGRHQVGRTGVKLVGGLWHRERDSFGIQRKSGPREDDRNGGLVHGDT